MFRLVFLTFTGNFRGTEEQKHHLHESPSLITFPLVVLALLAAVAGFLGLPESLGFHHAFKGFLSPVFAQALSAHTESAEGLSMSTDIALMVGAFTAALLSIGYAYYKYVSGGALPNEEGAPISFVRRWVYNKYYVDEIYNLLVVAPVGKLSELFYEVVDKTVVDGIVNRSGRLSVGVGSQLRKLQSGYIGFYLLAMVLSMVAIFLFAFIIK